MYLCVCMCPYSSTKLQTKRSAQWAARDGAGGAGQSHVSSIGLPRSLQTMPKYGGETHVGRNPEAILGVERGGDTTGQAVAFFTVSLINSTWLSQHCALGNCRLAEDSPKNRSERSHPPALDSSLCASPIGSVSKALC